MLGHYPMKECQTEGCTNKMWKYDPAEFCEPCRKKRAEVPEDPEAEAREALTQRFREMLFSEREAAELADVWADPLEVGWKMEKHGISHIRAAQIFGKGKPSQEDA